MRAYADEKSEMEELSMVALSACVWLQAFVVTLEMNTFTIIQILAIWGNSMAFYAINCVLSAITSFGMYAIIFRLCRQPAYWATMVLIVDIGMGLVFALKYLRYMYRPNAINILQQAERSRSPVFSIGALSTCLCYQILRQPPEDLHLISYSRHSPGYLRLMQEI